MALHERALETSIVAPLLDKKISVDIAAAIVTDPVLGVPKVMVGYIKPATTTALITLITIKIGKVLHPGIYRLPVGSRAIDAIKAAGKQLKGVSLTDINLAEILSDGQQIIVGAPAITSSSSKSKKSSASKGKITSGTIDINTATVAQFEQLPGVGAVMAARIFAYRTAHGAFATIDDLTKVSGMGKSKFANLKSFVRI